MPSTDVTDQGTQPSFSPHAAKIRIEKRGCSRWAKPVFASLIRVRLSPTIAKKHDLERPNQSNPNQACPPKQPQRHPRTPARVYFGGFPERWMPPRRVPLGYLDNGAPGSPAYAASAAAGVRWALNWARETVLRQANAWRWRAAVLLAGAALAVGQRQGVTQARAWIRVIQAAVPHLGGPGQWREPAAV